MAGRVLVMVGCIALVYGLLTAGHATAATTADMVIRNGKVITVDSNFSVKQAVAIKDGRILAVGTDKEIEPFVGAGTKVLDLKGKAMLPGIIDSHGHYVWNAATNPPLAINLRFPAVKSIADAVALLAAEVKETKPNQWIWGFGWDSRYLKECVDDKSRQPTKDDLDAVSPNNPVIFIDSSGHNMWTNSKAMQLAGVTKATPDPKGGVMVRNPATGEPIGLFKEFAAQGLIMKVAPLLTREQRKQAVFNSMKLANFNGITSYVEAALGPGGDQFFGGLLGEPNIEIYKELYDQGKLTTRVTVLLLFGEYGALTFEDVKKGIDTYHWPPNVDEKWLRFPGVKIFADGIPITHTAWLWEPYVGGDHGTLAIPGANDQEKYESLKKMIKYAHKKGYQVGVHATGDRAISSAIDGFIEAMREEIHINPRDYIVHGNLFSPADLKRAAQYRIGLTTQPVIYSRIAHAEPSVVGEKRAAYEMPYRTALDAGVRLAFSSDTPVTYPDWRAGVQAAILRESLVNGKAYGAEQRCTLEEAIRAYTINGAWMDHMDDIKGSIEKGKLADFCVLSDDILSIDPHKIKDIKVLMTIVDGKTVYEAPSP